ncbi:MAG TPA: hypothetical protein VK254_02835 [Candidatus Bathyarchaeia archaeon]|nr:hypothetical protein [Candidatus Bathyarchaeia archaeon]
MLIEKPKIWQKVSFFALIAGVIAIGLYFSICHFRNERKIDYVIPGVPYIGSFNHVGDFSQLDTLTSETVAALEIYWYPGEKNNADISLFFNKISSEKPLFGAKDVSDYFVQAGKYSAKIEHLQLDALKKYINPDARTPLLVFLALDADQPIENIYSPTALVIGIKESEQKLVLHDPWAGNNFEISFDEFNKRMERMRPEWRNNYIVVQPTDFKNKLKEMKSRSFAPYPARTQTMEKTLDMFRNYALGWGADQAGQFDSAIGYFQKAKNDPRYEEYFPPAFKVYLTAYLAEAYSRKKDLDNATKYAAESISLDHDLDKPFKDWPGYELRSNAAEHFGEITIPYRVQGDIYLAMKNFQKAKESYARALVIRPGNPLAKRGLAEVETALNKKQ